MLHRPPARLLARLPADRLVLRLARAWACTVAVGLASSAFAASRPDVQAAAEAQKQPMLDTMWDFVNIESGSKDLDGLAKLAALIAERLKALGGTVETIKPTDIFRMDDTPEAVGSMVHAEWKGTGTAKIMLIAHMDTVYIKGMLKDQPFRIDGDKAYGLGIADDKQGVALILHTVAMLNQLGVKSYGTLTVLINGDEEISSPGSRATITKMGAAHDLVLSFEGGGSDGGVRLATSGIGSAYLTVVGRTSHAGARPEGGVNAFYELAHQVLQMKDLSQNERGLKLNWTVAAAGTNRNVIPGQATAQADARALKVSDFDALQAELQKRVQTKLLPESKVSVKFEVRRPPLEPTDAGRQLAARARAIYADELGIPMKVYEVATGGGTDAAFAALQSKGAVIEGLGLSGFGAHSNDAEYVQVGTIMPRLYLATRMVIEVAGAKGR